MKKLVLFAIHFLWAGYALAFPPNQCGVLLQYGIYDRYNVVDSTEIFERTKQAYCNSSESDWGVSLPIMDIPVEGSASFKNAACGNSDSTKYQSYFMQRSAQVINSDIINGFNQCIKTANPGITYYVKTAEDPSRFTIELSFTRFGSVVTDRIKVRVEGATCTSPQINRPTVDGELRRYKITTTLPLSCKRKKEDAAVVTVFSEKGQVNTESITLPGWKEKVKPTSFKFYGPQVEKAALDMCPGWASNCSPGGVNGKAAATLWCNQRQLGDALDVKVLMDTPPTKIITTGQLCNQGTCDRVTEITCAVPN
jgi:hypothetical protein|nr:hypothetical protein [Neorhizobium tomejilense]